MICNFWIHLQEIAGLEILIDMLMIRNKRTIKTKNIIETPESLALNCKHKKEEAGDI